MSDKTVTTLRALCTQEKLKVPEYFYAIEIKELERIWNGWGPEDWPTFLRSFITFIYRNFEEAALPHDVRFEYSDGTIEGVKIANQEMFDNLKILLSIRYPWSKLWLYPLRVIAWTKIQIAIIGLSSASGFEAYYEAYKGKSCQQK